VTCRCRIQIVNGANAAATFESFCTSAILIKLPRSNFLICYLLLTGKEPVNRFPELAANRNQYTEPFARTSSSGVWGASH
jgi:hypothetical protein